MVLAGGIHVLYSLCIICRLLLCNFRLGFLPSENYPSDLFAVFCIRKENLSSVFKANSRVWQRKPLGAEVLVSRELFHRNAVQQHWRLEAESTTSFQSCCIWGRQTIERWQDEFVYVSQYPPAPQCRLHDFLRESRDATLANCVYSTFRNRTRLRIFPMVLPLEMLKI